MADTALWDGEGSSSADNSVEVMSLLTSGLRIAGIMVRPGQTSSDEYYDEAFRLLVRMLARWSIEPLQVYRRAITQMLLTPGAQQYSVGVGGDVVIRQHEIDYACTIDASGRRQRIAVLTSEEFSRLEDPTATSSLITAVYLDRDHPLATLYVYPVPEVVGTVELHYREKLPSLTTREATVDLPDGYEEAITYNLALRIATHAPLDTHIMPEAFVIARESLAAIEGRNLQPAPLMDCDAGALGASDYSSFDILTNR